LYLSTSVPSQIVNTALVSQANPVTASIIDCTTIAPSGIEVPSSRVPAAHQPSVKLSKAIVSWYTINQGAAEFTF